MERARDRKFADSPLEHAVASLMSDLHKHADTHPTLEDIQDGTTVIVRRCAGGSRGSAEVPGTPIYIRFDEAADTPDFPRARPRDAQNFSFDRRLRDTVRIPA
jgi:hypothetical protein